MTKIEKFEELVAFYEQFKTVQAAICVQKGSIAPESYVGRFFGADVLELLIKTGGKNAEKYTKEFDAVKGLVTPSKKPIHERTLEEFAKVMQI